jgi:CheY-like chemotaxis protein
MVLETSTGSPGARNRGKSPVNNGPSKQSPELIEPLVRGGYCATWFTDPQEALAISLEVKPDLLIAKLLMPSLNGIDLALEVASTCPRCKLVLFSEQVHASEHVRYFQMLGHNLTHWALPTSPQSILSEMHQMLVSLSNDMRVEAH